MHPVDKVLLEDADVRQAVELYANDSVSRRLRKPGDLQCTCSPAQSTTLHGAATVQWGELAIQEVAQLKQTHASCLMVLPAPRLRAIHSAALRLWQRKATG